MPMTLRLTEKQAAALDAAAKREGRTKTAIAKLAIDEYITRHGRAERRTRLLEEIVADNAAVLRRLGDA